MDLWRTVVKIADALADHETRWCLVGGLMVALFAIEAGQLQRPTTDIDILGDARQRPSGTRAVADRLKSMGGSLKEVSGLEARTETPTLLGAVLLKARSLEVHDRRQDQREDLVTLLSVMTDPRATSESMKPSERRWLRSIEVLLDIADRRLEAIFDEAQLRIARASYERLKG